MTYWQTCDNCNGKKTLHAPCPDEAKYRARGESCLVLHYQTCPKCHGEGKVLVEGMLIPDSEAAAVERIVNEMRARPVVPTWKVEYLRGAAERLLRAACGKKT